LSLTAPEKDLQVNESTEQVFHNAQLVLADTVVHGSLQVVDGLIADISKSQPGKSVTGKQLAVDCQGEFLVPGLIELHTDHLEIHYSPRPGVRWGMMSAIQSHDAQVAAAGITTVYDCLRVGQEKNGEFATGEMKMLAKALRTAREQNRLRAEHLLHLRCEVSTADVMDDFHDFDNTPDVGLVSLMDHAPGQRQFTSMAAYAAYHKGKTKLSDKAFNEYVASRVRSSEKYSDKHRNALSTLCRERKIPMASHDDATPAHVEESIKHGVRVAEFPTTLAAAQASHRAGLSVLMGAPNVVRGLSHSGNVAARTLVENHCLDLLSSDYVPSSLLQAAFMLSRELELISVPEAISLITRNPAKTMNLSDRGELRAGLRADLVRVAHNTDQDQAPIVRGVWRQGIRVS